MLGKPIVSLLAEAYLRDPMFLLHSDGTLQSNVFEDTEVDLPSFSMLVDLCRVFESWQEGVGREEVFIGSLKDFFPVHAEAELEYLKRDWGRFGILYLFRGICLRTESHNLHLILGLIFLCISPGVGIRRSLSDTHRSARWM